MPKKAAGADDLFEAALRERLAVTAPLADRLRPKTLDEAVGQHHPLAPGKPTLARVVANATERAFEPMSAVTAGVKDVRDTVAAARTRLAEHGQGTILFLDEVHRFNKAQQDALLPAVEDGTLTLIGATTENPFFEVNAPLMSRSTLFRLQPLEEDDLRIVLQRGLDAEGATIEDDAA